MIFRLRTLFPILLSGLLAACGDPHISQDDLEAALVKQQPKLDVLAVAIEKHKETTGDYPTTLSEIQIKSMPSVSLPAAYKSLRTALPQYELAREKSFFRLTYAVSDANDYNIYAASSYISYDKQWQVNWDPERFIWLEIRHYGQDYQGRHSARDLDLTVQSLMEATKNNSAYPCRNFWQEWVVSSLGQGGSGRESFPTVNDSGEVSIYPALDGEGAYAFVTTEKPYRPMTKPLRIVTAVYRLEDKSTGWELLQTCDSSE